MDLRKRTRDISDTDYDNSFEEFCKDRNGTVARRNGVKREFLKVGGITAYFQAESNDAIEK